MGSQLMDKKNLFLTILTILVVALIITVLIQNRHLNELNKKINNLNLKGKVKPGLDEEIGVAESDTGKKRSKIKNDIHSSEKIEIAESASDYEKQIEKLKSQIADMQAWQDYLEDTVNKESKEQEKRDEMLLESRKSFLATRLEPFFDRNDLPPGIKSKPLDLRFEAENEFQEIYKSDLPREELIQEQMKARERHEDQIAELLSEKDYAAYNEFKKLENEWGILGQMKNDFISHDLKLEKNQEEQLVDAMYDARQEMIKVQSQKLSQRGGYENLSQEEMRKISLDYQKTINSVYVENAKNILSEPQLQIFKRYFDNQTYMYERAMTRSTIIFHSSKKENDEEE